jgi:hypothetical protein
VVVRVTGTYRPVGTVDIPLSSTGPRSATMAGMRKLRFLGVAAPGIAPVVEALAGR